MRFVGHQKDTRPFVAACDVTLNTSNGEPLGLSVLESLAMQRPVIAIAKGGIPEIVENRWYNYPLHAQRGAMLKALLYFQGTGRVVVINVPWYVGKP